jgi:hypothetical protein
VRNIVIIDGKNKKPLKKSGKVGKWIISKEWLKRQPHIKTLHCYKVKKEFLKGVIV